MLSKRKALIGYGVYTLGKPIAKRRAKKAVPAPTTGKKRLVGGIAAAVAAAGAAVGGLVFWRKRRSGSAESTD
jgi:ferric-dicitrate binding protein FerR (iron transport regulator)